jgi:hypothetical protein
MKIKTLILFIFICSVSFGQRTTFDDKIVLFLELDSVNIEVNEMKIYTPDSTFNLEKHKSQIFKIPKSTNLEDLIIDSVMFKNDFNVLVITGDNIFLFNNFPVIRISASNSFIYDCVEYSKLKGRIWVTNEGVECENMISIITYQSECMLINNKQIIEDCLWKQRKDLEYQTMKGGIPAQFEK